MTHRRAEGLSSRDVWIVLFNVSVLALGVLLLWTLRTLVGWILVATLLALALQPAMMWLTRHRFKRGWAVLTLFLVVTAVGVTMVATLAPMVAQQGRDLWERAPELIDRIEQSQAVQWVDRHFKVLERIKEGIGNNASDVAGPAFAVASSVFEGVIGAVTVIVLSIFMLLFGDEVLNKGLAWFRPGPREHWHTLLRDIRKVVGGYVAGTFLVASIGGLVMGTTLAILGVPYFLPLGLVMIVLGVIPFLGSILGATLLVGLTFASAGMNAGLICTVVYLVYQQIENEILQPVVQRRTISMNPLFITLALLAGTGIAGVFGTVLALPIAGALQVLLQDALSRRQARWEEMESSRPSSSLVLRPSPENHPVESE